MLTKRYFDKHSIEFNDNSSIEEFVVSTLGVPVVWMDQVHGTKIQLIHENTVNLIEACDGLYTEKENISLPEKLFIRSNNIQLRLVIQNWEI